MLVMITSDQKGAVSVFCGGQGNILVAGNYIKDLFNCIGIVVQDSCILYNNSLFLFCANTFTNNVTKQACPTTKKTRTICFSH